MQQPIARPLPTLTLAGETCPQCGETFARLRESGLCLTCDGKAKEARHAAEIAEAKARDIAQLLEGLDAYLDDQLKACGMARREREAVLDRIDRPTRAAMPREPVLQLLQGGIPAEGWGMLGSTGTGKTMALAGLVKAQARKALERRIPDEGKVAIDWIRWESWPELADWLRDHCRSEPERVEARLRAACTAPILVLDDLCGERRTGDYSAEYAVGKLDLIVDARYRERLPTWYTANVEDESGLLAAYGARFVSRLCGTNRTKTLRGEDRRLVEAP